MTPLALPEQYPADPQRSLLVVPHAGGGSAVANPLRAALPDTWLVAGVQFGGRESRFADPPPSTLDEMVTDVLHAAGELAEHGGRVPTVLGQCSGALLAYLAAARQPAAFDSLVAVSRPAPSWPGVLPNVAAGDEEFLADVVAVGGVPDEVAAMPELLELLAPALRADFTALHEWSPADPAVPLDLSVLAVHAADDRGCPPDGMAAWQRYAGRVRQAELSSGGHFLLSGDPSGLANLMTEQLSAAEGHTDAQPA